MNYRIDFHEQSNRVDQEYHPIILNVQNMSGREITVVTHKGDEIGDLKMFILDHFDVFLGDREEVPEFYRLKLLSDDTEQNLEDYVVIDGTVDNDIHDGLTLRVFVAPNPLTRTFTLDNEITNPLFIRIANNQLFVLSEHKVSLFSMDGELQQKFNMDLSFIRDMCVSPDGRVLYLANNQGIYMYETQTLRPIDTEIRQARRDEITDESNIRICLSEDGSTLFASIFQTIDDTPIDEFRVYHLGEQMRRDIFPVSSHAYGDFYEPFCTYTRGKLFVSRGDYISVFENGEHIENIELPGEPKFMTSSDKCIFVDIQNNIVAISLDDYSRTYIIPFTGEGNIIGYTDEHLYVHVQDTIFVYSIDQPSS